MTDRPVLIDLDDTKTAPSPADAPPVAEVQAAPDGQAMQTLAALATRKGSRRAAWFWRLLLAIVVFLAGIAAYDTLLGLLSRSPLLAATAVVLFASFSLVCLVIILGELGALARLRRMDHLHREAVDIRTSGNLEEARSFARKLITFYKDRTDISWGASRLEETINDSFDAETVFLATEDQLLAALDARAMREVETAARQVATITALVPLAFADVIAALTSNLRMIRQIAQIYGGRAGTLGSWRLTRAVIAHLVATGAVAVGDDLLGSLGGGHLLGKISRRFGEGLVNGALTARVGVAAIEVCRPLPFSDKRRPRVSALVGRALAGLFGTDKTD
ncbi:MAG: TIGR01620 family protein [Pseudomonadota bacterium]